MSKQTWYEVKDVAAFLADKGKTRRGAHSMTRPLMHWRYCSHCGLLNLKNDATRRALRQPCVSVE